MLRSGLLYLSRQDQIFRFVRGNGLARKLASRFVAGETLDEALEAVRGLNARSIAASLDLLGESVQRVEDSRAATLTACRMLERIAAERLQANVSIKLTQFGLDLSTDLCRENVRRVLERARQLGQFVRIDMESSAYTQRTLDLFEDDLYPAFGEHVGVVIQSCLRRSAGDVEMLNALGARVRLCKGAYLEPPGLAYPHKRDVDLSYARLAERLLSCGVAPALATHDTALIAHTRAFARRQGIGPHRFEFQMLYGVRRDLQEDLVRAGYRVRVYVPFGTQWYPYLMRRLAERPANIAFILGSVVKEAVGAGGDGGAPAEGTGR